MYNDGCTYYWPQNSKTTSSYDYVLVKHVDSGGNAELQYKQLVVQMPDIDVQGIQGDIDDLDDDIDILSGRIDDLSAALSGQVSGDYWESGGSASTCYGSSIGDSNGNTVINLDGNALLDSYGMPTVEWASMVLNGDYGSTLDWNS